MFALLVFFAAFLIEAIGTYVSVVGLSALFAANPVVIILAVALDVGKLVAVSFVYKYWTKINFLMKSYMTIATCVLVLITSAGAFGFLSGEFQRAIAGNSQQTVVIKAIEEEQARLQKRKEEIDKQIAQLPEANVRGRTQLIRQFGPEVKRLNDRLAEIDKKLPDLKVANIEKEVHVGPIMYVAEAFETTPEKAVKWVILIIIFVFDPLAIALLIAGNFLLELKKKPEQEPEQELEKLVEEISPKNTHKDAWDPGEKQFWTNGLQAEVLQQKHYAPSHEKVVIKPPPKKTRKLKVEQKDDKEVIKLTPEPPLPSMLEQVNERGADVMPASEAVTHVSSNYTDR